MMLRLFSYWKTNVFLQEVWKNTERRNNRPMSEFKNKKRSPVPMILITLMFLLAEAGMVMLHWFDTKWSTGFQEMLYTMTSPLKGTGSDILNLGLRDCLPPMLIIGAAYTLAMVLCCNNRFSRRMTGQLPGHGRERLRKILCIGAAVLVAADVVYAQIVLDFFGYFSALSQQTALYDEQYIDPCTADITFPETRRNVVWIFVESL